MDRRAGLVQRRQDRQARAVAHVVGVGLEGQAEHRQRLAVDVAAAGLGDAVRHAALARVVDAQHRIDDRQRPLGDLGGADQRLAILREARPAEAGAGMQELAADPAVEADAAGDVLHIGADRLAQIGDLVDEGDLGREKGVGGVFDQLGAFQRR